MESQTDVASVTSGDLSAIEDEEVINKMLDNATDFEERRILRAALRELLKKKRNKREQDRGARQQDLRQQGLSKGGKTGGAVNVGRASMTQQPPANRPSGQPSPSAASEASPAAASAQKCPPAAAPNVKNVKQMLLDWCRAKTEPYEGVDIRNFSSSWKDGIAFCALVHRFFPDAFEYSTLNPNKPKENFQLAFDTAERLAGCPPLLEADDLVRMKEPDWKCVFTYIQEFYRCLVEKGLVKTKKRP
ncbi:smoothelin [Pseudoliparis swirei]|uniref:smoothelin n=1 Tax=Pseudoliparis swirei TaxID=2059687 RepID=UPI0024BDFD5C|nr:smoothelin [Pseudoliparis swirei]XP_056288736.1 smoothelin [Pseudoliparis swirei]